MPIALAMRDFSQPASVGSGALAPKDFMKRQVAR